LLLIVVFLDLWSRKLLLIVIFLPVYFATVNRRALLLEDDPDVAHAVQALLEVAEYAVEWVSECDAAIARGGAAMPDLLVFDVDVHEQSGVTAFLRLRDRDPEVPVVFVTGGLGLAVNNVLFLPRVALLRKPFTLDALLRAIATVTT
jgi:Response regulator containing CheY-like receiver, AAA-type ATPase, and DNA-binding domains